MLFFDKNPSMTTKDVLLCVLLSLWSSTNLASAAAVPFPSPEEDTWKGFRGDGTSHSKAGDLALTWSESENISWRADLEGFGQSSPVVQAGKVYLTSVLSESESPLLVFCIDLASGKVVWKKAFEASKKRPWSKSFARAAPTPVVDETGVYAFFGSGDVLKLGHDGTLHWSRSLVKDYGDFKGNHGVGSSPIYHDGRLTLLIAHEGPSYVVNLDAKTGKTLWKKDRPEAVSWSTPLVTRYRGKDQLIISSNGTIEALDFQTGERLWFTTDIEKNTVASPTRYGDLIIAGSSAAKACTAIRLGGRGDITRSHVAWRASSSSFGSPLVDGDRVYIVNRGGVLTCLDADNGEEVWKHRLGDSCWASPVATADRLYFFGKAGKTIVLANGTPEPKVLAENDLPVGKEDAVYGVAFVNAKVLIRTGGRLTCVAVTD